MQNRPLSIINRIFPGALRSIIMRIYYRCICDNIIIGRNTTLSLKTSFEGMCKIGPNSDISKTHVGLGTFIASNCRILQTKVGRFTSIGQNVKTRIGIHPVKDFVSTHPAFFSNAQEAGFTFTNKDLFPKHKYIPDSSEYVVDIGNDVWIGDDVRILDGITIGDGAVVGLGAVVTKNVEPYAIVAGVPAKVIGFRFTQEQIAFLLKFKWWNKDIAWIKDHAKEFVNITDLMRMFNDEHKQA